MLQYPLGNTNAILASALVNIIGEDGYSGNAKFEGLDDVLKMENSFVHLYGKSQTKPGRKMGHITMMSKDYNDLVRNAHYIKKTVKVIA